MKTLDIVAAVLLVVGGLNWGLVGIFRFDLVAAIFGSMSILSRIIYTLIGVATVYEAAGLKGIRVRWGVVTAQSPK